MRNDHGKDVDKMLRFTSIEIVGGPLMAVGCCVGFMFMNPEASSGMVGAALFVIILLTNHMVQLSVHSRALKKLANRLDDLERSSEMPEA